MACQWMLLSGKTIPAVLKFPVGEGFETKAKKYKAAPTSKPATAINAYFLNFPLFSTSSCILSLASILCSIFICLLSCFDNCSVIFPGLLFERAQIVKRKQQQCNADYVQDSA